MNDSDKHIRLRRAAKLRYCLGLALLLTLFLGKALAQTTPTRSYQVKAAFLYNFCQFVEWPSHSLSRANDPFIIGVLGPDPFGSYLDELVAGEKMKGHPIIINRYTDVKEIKDCHILYINLSNTTDVLNALGSRSILTVSDANFTHSGGMIRFFTADNKIRLEINPSAVKAANLNISSKLLRVAEKVDH